MVWWQQNENRFPHIAKMARQYLGVPATTASVERVFTGVNGLTFADLLKNMKDRVDLLNQIQLAKFMHAACVNCLHNPMSIYLTVHL